MDHSRTQHRTEAESGFAGAINSSKVCDLAPRVVDRPAPAE
jgi:hypothetical protein